MVEATFRKIHRTVGIYLVWFLAVQAITGLFLALGTLAGSSGGSWWLGLMAAIHHEWNPVGSVYRVLLGVFTAAQGLGGVIIYLLMRARLRKS